MFVEEINKNWTKGVKVKVRALTLCIRTGTSRVKVTYRRDNNKNISYRESFLQNGVSVGRDR